MIIINGKEIAKGIIEELKKLPKPQKKLVAILVGENPASISFLKQKEKVAKDLEIEFNLLQLTESISEEDLISEINKLNRDEGVGGIIIQLPLPRKFDQENVIKSLNPEKDIDFAMPLAVEVVKDVLRELNYDLEDKIVGVVGRGLLIGKPIAEWLSGRCKEMLVFHSKSDLAPLKECDLVISGVGKAGLIRPGMLKSGASVIDFGFDMVDGKIRGDLELINSSTDKLSFYTPTPGGTGPILVAEIFKNFYKLSFF